MAKVISIINLKGGVGKTFTTFNLAYELQKRKQCGILVIDNDKQGNLSKAFDRYNSYEKCGMYKIMTSDYDYIEDTVVLAENKNIAIVTANMSLMSAIYKINENEQINQLNIIKDFLEAIIGYIDCDYILIDNPPDLGINVINALVASDEVIIPIRIDEWSLEGVEILAEQIEAIKETANTNLKTVKLLITMYQNNEINRAGTEWLKKEYVNKKHSVNYEILGNIRYSNKAAESTFFNLPVYEYSPRSGAAQDYKRIVTRYIETE